jgi:glutaredoxin-like protein
MLVKDGVIDKMFIEPDLPGDPFEVSDADTLLNYVNPQARQPKRVTLITKPGCSHCTRAKKTLQARELRFEEIVLGQAGISYSSLTAISGRGTTPQVFIDGQHVGTADDLEQWLHANF